MKMLSIKSRFRVLLVGLLLVLAAVEGRAQYARFDQNTDTIALAGETNLGTTATFEAVIAISDPAYATVFFEQVNGIEDKDLIVGATGVKGYAYNTASDVVDGVAPVSLNVFHHIAFVHDVTQQRVYLDGVLIGSRAVSGTIGNATQAGHPAAIGGSQFDQNNSLVPSFLGLLDSIRISNVARYSGASYTPPTGDMTSDANTLILFNFNPGDVTGNTITDLSGNGHTGTFASGFSGATAPTITASTTPPTATSFTEEFPSATINANLLVPAGFQFGPNSSPVGRAQNTSAVRRYVTTAAADYSTVDFVSEVTFTVNGGLGPGAAFFGFGSALQDSSFFNEPHTSIYLRAFPNDYDSGKPSFTVTSGPGLRTESNQTVALGNGTHRGRIQKTGNVVTLSIDGNSTSGAFVADYTFTRDLSADLSFLNNTNSRLFFGTEAGTTTFDNFSVTVTPTSIYTFPLTNGQLNGRDGWNTFNSNGPMTVSGGRAVGNYSVARAARVNDANYSFTPFTGNETNAILQFDVTAPNTGAPGNGGMAVGLGADTSADGDTLFNHATERAFEVGVYREVNKPIYFNLLVSCWERTMKRWCRRRWDRATTCRCSFA